MAKLSYVRRQKLLSQRDLAQRARITPSTIYLIESGRTRPQLRVMRRICDVLGVSPWEVDEFAESLNQQGVSPAPGGV
jgi:transcriptional regulator with XRE-family HTH domain